MNGLNVTQPGLAPGVVLDTDGTLAANSDTVVASQKATKAYADAKVAALVNSSPAALDTLKELADALGDDANYASTVTTSLAAKAPLASPAFTGNPTAPTASPGDNDTSIATTAFVTAANAARTGYRRLQTGRARLDALTAQTTGLNESQANGPLGSGGGGNVFYLDPADWPATATLRVSGIALVNDTTPVATFTFGLYPVTTTGGAAANVTGPFGTVVTGSTAAITTPTADTLNHAASTDFTPPTAGYYALGIVISANMAANSAAQVRATLDVKY